MSAWQAIVEAWQGSPVGQGLAAFLAQRRAAGAVIYPPEPLRALSLTPLENTRVVILGQDPYHGPGQAEGLAFSVPAGVKIPPSLRNIFKELQRDLQPTSCSLGRPEDNLIPPGDRLGIAQARGKPFVPPMTGSLQAWAERGVLLLNTCLTVEDGQPASHAKRGWEALTDALIAAAAADAAPKVFMLWGAHAQAKAQLIAAAGPQHLVLQANHPSPLSASRPPVPFIGCGHFSAAAAWLAARQRPLDWSLGE